MPPSHQRHRRSPFKRTSFRRTSSGSSSLRSFSEIQSPLHTNQSQLSNPEILEWKKENFSIRNVDTDKHSVTFHPTVMVTICRDEMTGTRNGDGETSQSQSRSQSHVLRCENIIGGIEGRDISPNPSSAYSISTLGYPTTNAEDGSYTSCSSFPTTPELSLGTLTSTSTSAVSVSDPDTSFLDALGKIDEESGVSVSNSRMQRWKSFGMVRGFLGGKSRRAWDGDEDVAGEEARNASRKGDGKEEERRERRVRPFLRKYCLHPFSMRSGFRLVGWIEDPVGCFVGNGTAYGTGYAYGGGIGDARLWDEARRSGWEGGMY
ncbi:uncharacterized protein EAF01_003913 [Botrytis porri]|uniref:uncharacterized protein n=1 Tax=Botrytis porri TaxID=87229 RepID=UPI001901728A|nr:uncharacterized protein EAF01_003913 [Botrytis porri]KAF7908158.1 hypothetical protein EAF01_003913 [Botrytis porri]